MRTIDRRSFLQLAGAAGAAGLVHLPDSPFLRSARAAEAASVDSIIHGKSAKMIIHNAKLGVMETPLGVLRAAQRTPKEIAYTRMHFPVSGENAWHATIDPAPQAMIEQWRIRVGGLVQRPKTVTMADLQRMPSVQRTSVMQCAGNGRSYYWDKAKTPGSGWQHGGMANLSWEGVPVRALLDSLELNPSNEVRYLTANGRDVPVVSGGADLIKSVPLDAPQLDDAILALRMNGEPIPLVHGGPVRLIIPGFYGNMNVKWVTDLTLDPEQTPSAFMQKTYRMPHRPVEPGKFTVQDLTQDNSDPTYGFAIMSVVFGPMAGETVRGGDVTIHGVAWNDGVVPISEVRVSLDRGATWHAAEFEAPDGPYAWHPWQLRISLASGAHEIRVRAIDAWGRTQPTDGLTTWNPGGWDWHGIDRVPFQVA